MDDIDGWPEVTGDRLGHGGNERWKVTLTPDGLRMEGRDRVATVPLDQVSAVRQGPAEDGDGVLLELWWKTALGEARELSLRSQDPAAAQRLAGLVASALRDLDGAKEGSNARRTDWVLVVLVAAGFALAVRDLLRVWPVRGAEDWTAAVTNLVVQTFALPVMYLLVRGLVRWLLSSRRASV